MLETLLGRYRRPTIFLCVSGSSTLSSTGHSSATPQPSAYGLADALVTEFLIALALGAHGRLGAPDADSGPGFVSQLLAPHPASLAATWVLDDEAITADRVRLWSQLLRRLNEERDALATVHPAALLLACPTDSLPQVRGLTATLDDGGFPESGGS